MYVIVNSRTKEPLEWAKTISAARARIREEKWCDVGVMLAADYKPR